MLGLRCMLQLFFLGLLTHYTCGVLSKRTCQYIVELLDRCKAGHGHGYSNIIPPPIPSIGDGDVSAEDFFLPSVIIWNPYLIYPSIIPPGSIKCIHCSSPMHDRYWNDGSSINKHPRILHGINNIVILVSAVYVCDNRHKILAHDEIVLEKFPSTTMIPFLLLHQTGFTRELVDMCSALCRRGINFYNLESMIIERRWETFARQQQLLQIHGRHLEQPAPLSDFWSSPISKSPSNDVLAKCFLAEFFNYENRYLAEMTSITVGESISFDHTFKVATNIGYLREDSKWISMYDGLFIILNENGQVVSWQLTKRTSFAHVETLLRDLLERPSQQIKTVYVDECCKLRAKIKSVFGPNVAVKLDLFHAVQRITKTLSKKHTYSRQCMSEFRCVFRCDGDSGNKRLSYTPPPEVMLSKFNGFVTKWKAIVDEKGERLFRSDTFTALDNIKRHISAGCLSGIPPGGGTNRNERLHEHINNFFNRSRIGILLAYALLTMIFHSHNTSTRLSGKCVVRPIVACPSQEIPVTNIKPIGIMPKERVKQQNLQYSDHWEMDKSTDTVDYNSIEPIYHTCLRKLQIKRSLQKMKLTQMTKSINLFREVKIMDKVNDDIDTGLSSRLSEYGLVFTPAVRDGNCFFHSVSMNIMSDLDRWNSCLTRIGTVDKLDIGSLSVKLRHAFVEEILGEHRESYKSFITNILDYHTEASKFLQDGYYASSLGDLMPLAMATVLQASIIIITSIPNSHPMYITPLVGGIEGTVILVYNPAGSGHYDAAVPYSTTVGLGSTEKVTLSARSASMSCRCGVNKKNVGNICSPSTVYASRCKCYLNSQACSSLCSCKDCANPYGVRITKPKGVKRIRRPHSLQVSVPTSKSFAVDRGESLCASIWSDFESIVLDEILSHYQEACAIDITTTYNSIVYYSKSTFCTIPLEVDIVFREKTNNQITSRIEFVNKHSV